MISARWKGVAELGRTDDDGGLARRELERSRDGTASRVEGSVRREGRVLVGEDKVAELVVHDAHVGGSELAVVDVRVEAERGAVGQRGSPRQSKEKTDAPAEDSPDIRVGLDARKVLAGKGLVRFGVLKSARGKASARGGLPDRRGRTDRASADVETLRPQLVLQTRLSDDEDLLVLGELEDLSDVDGRSVRRAEDLFLRGLKRQWTGAQRAR